MATSIDNGQPSLICAHPELLPIDWKVSPQGTTMYLALITTTS